MTAPYYDASGAPSTSSNLSSATIRGEFELIETSFNLLPAFSGNAGKVWRVNSGETAAEASDTITLSGVITGLTIEATGDTSAGDNAAMGFTATEGLILTGQGSTNDVTIKNDADTTVIGIATGTTTVSFAGIVSVDDTTDSTSGITGSIHTDGGVGIAKALFVGTTSTFAGTLSIDDTTDSTSGTTGSIQTDGGLGVAKAIFAGTTITANTMVLSTGSLTDTTGAISFDNENLSTTGTLASAAFTSTVSSTAIGITIANTGTGNGMFINQDGNGISLNIDSEATTANSMTLALDALTSGRGITVDTSNAGFTSAFGLLHANVGSSSATGRGLRIDNSGTGDAAYINQDGVGLALNIDSDTTTTTCIDVDANALSSGNIANFSTSSASFAGSNGLIFVDITNGSATGHGIRIDNAGTGTALVLDQNGNGVSASVASDSTTANVLNITANSLTSGVGINLSCNSASHASGLLTVVVDNTASVGRAALFQNDGLGTGVLIDQNGNARGLQIDTEATTAAAGLEVKADVLTTGSVAIFSTNTAATNNKNLVEILNDNVLAINTVLLDLNQDGSGACINIVTDSTTNAAINMVADSLASAQMLKLASNSSSASNRSLVEFINNHTSATGATVLKIQQDAAQDAIAIDMNGNGRAIDITTDALTATALNIDANLLTSGRLARFFSNAPSTTTRPLVEIVNENASATGATNLVLRQDAAQDALFIDCNGNGRSIDIDSEATTANTFNAVSATTTGISLSIVSNSLTTGNAAKVQSSSTSTSARDVMQVVQSSSAATSANSLLVSQASVATAIKVTHTGNGRALDLNGDSVTTATVCRIDADALTTGAALQVVSNSASTSTRVVVAIVQDHASASSAVALDVRQDSAADALHLQMNGNGKALNINHSGSNTDAITVVTSTTTSAGLRITGDSVTAGGLGLFVSSSASTTARTLLRSVNQSSSATNAVCISAEQSSSAPAILIAKGVTDGGAINITGTPVGNVGGTISTLTTSGTIVNHLQIEINGTKRWIAILANPS